MERSVLVVEDDPAIRLVLRTNLEDEGYRVVEAESGEQALDCMVEEKSDVVLVDLRLPLTFTPEDCAQIARIIRAEALAVGQGPEPDAVEAPAIQ